MITGNKGEWSEFYTFLKIIDERKLFFADADLNRINNKYYPVIGVLREERGQDSKFYRFNNNNIEIISPSNSILGVVDIAKVRSCANIIFETIKESQGAFSVPLAEELMTELKCTQIKAGNTEKADLIAKVKENGSPTIIDLGFSIKSMLGGAATLLNASRATNFIYKIENFNSDYQYINKINSRSKVRDRIAAIEAAGGKISFYSLASNRFKNNLRKIDLVFPEIIAVALKCFYSGNGSTMLEICTSLANNESLLEKYELNFSDFEYKIKTFLRVVALGMVPDKEWDGLNVAHGGYLIVKKDSNVVCYHLHNMDDFQEYLFKNTKFETPSTTRHDFGNVYEKDGELFINLNLQIRFLE